jgi:hypothetical protein
MKAVTKGNASLTKLNGVLLRAILVAGVLFWASDGRAQLLQADDTQTISDTQPDSVVRLTAEAQGLSAISYDNLPRSGTFWEVMPNGVMAPLPCPPLDSSLPIYNITGNSFLVDATGGQVSINARRLGMQTQLSESAAITAAMESLATSVVNLIDMVMNPPAQEVTTSMMRTSMMMSSLSTSYAYGNQVYLADLTRSYDGYGNFVFGFSVFGGTNFVPWDIEMSTNLTSQNWTWQGIAYTSNSYSFYGQSSGVAFYRLVSPIKTMSVGLGDDFVGQCDVPYGFTNAMQLAGGGGHTMALTRDGKVLSWGWNYYGQTNVPTGISNAVMIAAGYYHSVALLTNGSVVAWGLNSYPWPLAQVPSGLTNATVISALSTHTMALRSNGTVVVWGYDQGSGVTSVPASLTNVTAISAGGNHCLAVSNGFVVAWGANNYGQCTVPANLSNVVDVAGGAYHSLALKADGTVAAWGRANGETTVPSGLSNVVAIAAGGDTSGGLGYSLALQKDGNVVMWGDNAATDPVGGLDNVIGIAAGADHALALRTGPPTPVITLEPADEYQVQGGNAVFTARGEGLYGVTYQWQTNGVNLPGATSAALTLTNVQSPAQLASYRVVVGNEVGSIVSSNASLNFVTPPVIISKTMPTNQVAIYLTNLVLNVVATAPGIYDGFPLSYQWQFNGTNIAGATGSSYTIHTGANSFGTYSVLVSNAAGSTNAAWQVTVYYPSGLLITQQPTNQFQIAGGTINFYGAGVSSNAVAYQWQFNGTNIAGATNVLLTVTNVTAANEGYYNFVLNDGVGSRVSSNAWFYLVTQPAITSQSQPTNRVCIYGNYVSFTATASALYQTNGFPLSYRWQWNGTNIAGAISTNYNFSVNDTNSGIYSLVASNAAGTASVSWSVVFTNAINVTNDLLLIYNTNSAGSKTVLDYYLAHRLGVGGANVMGINCTSNESIALSEFTNSFIPQIQNWLASNPAKRPQYVVFFQDMPSLVTDTFASLQYHIYSGGCDSAWRPFVSSINMNGSGGTNDCIAYINKLATFGISTSSNSPILSASANGYGNTNYILDNVNNLGYSESIVSNAIPGLVAAGVQTNSISYLYGVESGFNLPHLTNAVNVAGYVCWGWHSSLGGSYPLDKVQWSGNSGWWIIRTVESFNGQRGGQFLMWFSSNAFGGTNYSNTPIGGPTYVNEPLADATDNRILFNLWASGKNLAICCWVARNPGTPPYLQVVGDPFVTR